MKRLYFLAVLGIATSVVASGASAQNWTFGLGTDGAHASDEQQAASLEGVWTDAPRGTFAGFDYGWGAGFEVDADGDVWAGAGLHAQHDFDAVRLSLSIMPGLYEAGTSDTELGGLVEIRSRLGVSVAAGQGRLGLSYAHISNAGLYDDNPGKNSAYLTYGWAY